MKFLLTVLSLLVMLMLPAHCFAADADEVLADARELYTARRYEEAPSAYQKLDEDALAPQQASALQCQAKPFYILKRYDEAQAAVDRHAQFTSDQIRPYLRIPDMVWQRKIWQETEKLDEAVAIYSEILAMDGELDRQKLLAWEAIGPLLVSHKRHKKAVKAFKFLAPSQLANNCERAGAMLHLGRALVELWEIKSARKVFAEVARTKEFLATHREQAELWLKDLPQQ